MSIIVISKKHLFGDLLASYCRSEGFEIGGVFNDLSQVREVADEDLILYHVDASMNASRHAQVSAFRHHNPSCKIVAIVSDQLRDGVLETFEGEFEAVLPNETSTRALAGFLTVVLEGYKITGPWAPKGARHQNSGGLRPPSGGEHRRIVMHEAPDKEASASNHVDRPRADHEYDDHGGNHGSDRGHDIGAPVKNLSLRELEVVELLMKGASNKEIAKRLNIVENTVKVHLRACYGKIGVKNRTQAALWAARNIGG